MFNKEIAASAFKLSDRKVFMSEKVSMMKGMTGHGAYMLIRMSVSEPDEIEELMQAWRIANAPEQQTEGVNNELLAALREMVAIAELTVGWMPQPHNADGPLIKARAAIAKAEGVRS